MRKCELETAHTLRPLPSNYYIPTLAVHSPRLQDRPMTIRHGL